MKLTYLSNIGESRDIYSKLLQFGAHEVSLKIDKDRTLKVMCTTHGVDETTVQCSDTTAAVTFVIHLPHKEGTVASATMIDCTAESNST